MLRRSWVDRSEERMWKPSVRKHIISGAHIISSGEGKVMGGHRSGAEEWS